MKHHARQSGFTMVELLVTIGIFTILTGVVLAKYRTFGTNAEFVNAGEDIVLALRQVQVYGAGTKSCNGSSFTCAYGVYLTPGSHGFIVFIDANNDKVYRSADDTIVESVTWRSSISIDSIQCETTPCVTEMNITFNRPNPDACITDAGGALNRVGKGVVTLKDANTNKITTITITSAGQVSI